MNRTLTNLNLEGNHIGDEVAVMIGDLLKVAWHAVIDEYECLNDIDDEPAAAICESLVVTWHAVFHEL